jgi:hypothetical protein
MPVYRERAARAFGPTLASGAGLMTLLLSPEETSVEEIGEPHDFVPALARTRLDGRLAHMRRGLGAAVGLALLACITRASADAPAPAQRPAAALEFRSTSTEPSCPTERDFRDHVVGRLGFDPFVAGAPRTLAVTLRDDNKKVRAAVVLRGGEGGGRRELEANRSECGELGDSVAIAVSMILDPLGTGAAAPPAAPPAPAPAPPPPPPAPPVAPPPAPAAAERPTEAPRRFVTSFEVAPQASLGRGPSVTFGGRLGAFAASGPWAIGVEAMLESTAGFVTTPPERARALFAGGNALACRKWPWLVACALGAVGVAQGEVETLAPVRRTLASWAGARVGVPLCAASYVCFTPTLDVVANVVRTRFRANESDMWTSPPVAATLALALDLTP